MLARGIVGTRGDVPFVASPMHKQAFDLRTGECLDDAGRLGADVRRPRRSDGVGAWSGDSATMTPVPSAAGRATGSGSRLRARSRSRSRCSSGAAPRSSGRPALSIDPNRVDDDVAARGDRGGAGRAGRHVPRDHRHRHEDAGSRPPSRGGCSTSCSARWARPRSWPAARRASARCAGAGCASCGRRSRRASRTCSRTCAAATSPACGSWCRSTASRCRWPRTRCAVGAPTSPRSTVYRVDGAEDPEPMFRLVDADRRPRARRGHVHLRPGRGRADGGGRRRPAAATR